MTNHQMTALVTGATGAIGLAIARQLVIKNYHVVITARDVIRGEHAVHELQKTAGNPQVRCEFVDLSRKHEIEALAQRWRQPLHVLVNVAAATFPLRQETPEGIECQFATNVLNYFWMMRFFADTLLSSAPARVVNVASCMAGDLDLTDLEFKRRPYLNESAYRQSKQADRMLTAAVAQRWETWGVTVNSCHPGDVNSKLSNNLGFGGHKTPDQGAETPVWLATSLSVIQETGKYFENQRQVRCPFSEDQPAVDALYSACLDY